MTPPRTVLIVSALIGAAGGWLYEAHHAAPPVPQVDFDLSALASAFEVSAQATNAAWGREDTPPPVGEMQPLHKRPRELRVGYMWRRLRRILMAVWFGSSTRVAPAPVAAEDCSRQNGRFRQQGNLRRESGRDDSITLNGILADELVGH